MDDAAVDAISAESSADGIVGAVLALPTGLAFRGQGDADYRLGSSLSRRLATIVPEDRRRIEQRIVGDFATALGDQLDDGSNLGDVLSIMQHHGAPTRLIDVSVSPLVALYFACSNLSSTDGRVYVFDIEHLFGHWHAEATRLAKPANDYRVLGEPNSFRKLQEANLGIQVDEGVPHPLPYKPSRSSDRMRAQSGLFLAEPLSRDWITDVDPPEGVCSFTIGGDLKPELLRICLRTNNGGSTLFPGLDGVGKEIVERHVVEENLSFGWG
ncbi:MAG: FRG domain-containing protein [Sulfitobacter sp.]|nr:FRG domain-containing protein [Sulfitobacter sp.]